MGELSCWQRVRSWFRRCKTQHDQDLRDSPTNRIQYVYHKRGWAEAMRWEHVVRRRIDGHWFQCGVTIGGDEGPSDLQVSLGLLWASGYWTFCGVVPERWRIPRDRFNLDESDGREWGISLYRNHLSFHWRATVMSSGRDRSKYGIQWGRFVDEWILGRIDYHEEDSVQERRSVLEMPEGIYHLDIRLYTGVWRYRRWPYWPLVRMLRRADIQVVGKGGIPTPGKGENSWDCGDSSTSAMTCPASSVFEALSSFRASIEERRIRYGSGPAMYRDRESQKEPS